MDKIPITDSQAGSVNIIDKSAKPSLGILVHKIIVSEAKGDQPAGKKACVLGQSSGPLPGSYGQESKIPRWHFGAGRLR